MSEKKEFLSQIERIVPWKEWLAMLQPCYYKGECGEKCLPWDMCWKFWVRNDMQRLRHNNAEAGGDRRLLLPAAFLS